MTWGRSPSFSVVVIALIFFSGYNLGGNMCTPPPARPTSSNEAAPQDDVPPECPSVMRGPGVPTFKVRDDLGAIVQSEGFVRGMELGVQRGHFSKQILSSWPDCVEYHLIDLWAPQENYKDVANVNQQEQDKIYNEAMESVAPWKEKIHVCRNYTTACVDNYDDVYFDFKGVWEDITKYWHKLKEGGIMAGHDYVTQEEVRGQNWTLNYDGTVDRTGTVVKGAVDTFAKTVCRQVTVSYRERFFNSWAIRK